MIIFTSSFFNKIFSSSPLLSKNLRFITTTNTTFSFNNFNQFFSSRVYFFIFNNNICIAHLTTSKTPCLCHLTTEIYNRDVEEHTVDNQYFFLFKCKKVKFDFYVYTHITLAKNLLSLVLCSGEIGFLEIASSNLSETLNLVEFIISSLLSI